MKEIANDVLAWGELAVRSVRRTVTKTSNEAVFWSDFYPSVAAAQISEGSRTPVCAMAIILLATISVIGFVSVKRP